jgi:hypothetical protein
MYLSLRYITTFQYFITSYYYNMMHYYYYFILLQYLLLLNTTSLLLITCKHPLITKQQVLGEITTWLLPLLHYLHYYKPQLLRITTITHLPNLEMSVTRVLLTRFCLVDPWRTGQRCDQSRQLWDSALAALWVKCCWLRVQFQVGDWPGLEWLLQKKQSVLQLEHSTPIGTYADAESSRTWKIDQNHVSNVATDDDVRGSQLEYFGSEKRANLNCHAVCYYLRDRVWRGGDRPGPGSKGALLVL